MADYVIRHLALTWSQFFATLASLKALASGQSSYAYPKETLDTSWEKVLLNQFHDVLPGSAM